MSDPLAATISALPARRSHLASTTGPADAPLSSRWASLLKGSATSPIETLRARGVEGKIASDNDASLRWLQWKLFLVADISHIPSSWNAVLQRDREAYNELRCRLLRAPDGNYPPEVGFDGTHTTLDSSSSSSSSDSIASQSMASVVNDLAVNNPLSLDDSNPWKAYYTTLETRRIILQDVERTFPDLELFRQTRVQQSLTNILFLWCLENEDVGYRQGMHELAAVLWKVRAEGAVDFTSRPAVSSSQASAQNTVESAFEHALARVFVEHDVYTLFRALMRSAKAWYVWRDVSHRPLPIVAKCEHVLELLRHIDPALAQHLGSLGIEPQIFCLRWIRMIFTREFALEEALAIWDGLFASGSSLDLVNYICIAMLLRIRNQLLAGDHSSALQSLLRYPGEAQVQPSLLVKQAIFLRDNGRQPSTGVAVVMQNRDLLGIRVRSVDDHGESNGVQCSESTSPSNRYSAQKFATVGRSPSASSTRPSPWARLSNQATANSTPNSTPTGQHRSRPDPRRWQSPVTAADPLGASSDTVRNADANGPRAFGINPSAYLPEGIGDLAKGWYERAELPQGLNSALANVSRTVAAAAAAGVAGAYGTNKTETSGFPSGFEQAFNEQTGGRGGGSPSTVGHAASAGARSRPSIDVSAEPTSPSAQRSAAQLSEPLRKVTAANKAIGSALSACIEVLEQSWLDRSAIAHTETPEGFEQSDLNTLMSFTALKHIRDVLEGTATEFDPATLPAPVPKRVHPQDQTPPNAIKDAKAERDIQAQTSAKPETPSTAGVAVPQLKTTSPLPMSLPEYARYGRQMILPDFGLPAQLRLRDAKVLVVGAGGLGCPAVQYLAAAGVGQISILDHDVVEPSNLARQILHSDATVGMHKAVSAAKAARQINPYIKAVPVSEAISAANARQMMRGHDLVLDCTDNPLTRYLISDAAVLEGVQVVSGAAQGYDGQLVVLHKRIKAEFADPKATATSGVHRGPCYRCLFPKAPRPDEVTNCEDGGVLGGVTGLVGTMQALEAVKILAGIGEDTPPMLTLVSPLTATPFRCVKIRPRRVASCRSCGDPAQVPEPVISDLETEDYVSFCGLSTPASNRAAVARTAAGSMTPSALIVDVRPAVEYGITKLDGSLNIPIQTLLKNPGGAWDEIREAQHRTSSRDVLVICKKGNDSQLAVRSLTEHQKQLAERTEREAKAAPSDPLQGPANTGERKQAVTPLQISDLIGGLRAYSKEKDPNFPIY
ncbi:Adenylyltransferase and sulfurtransferase UBA4 [Pseudozyma hubeiensis]|nr:Adenylyltransferase and sulfurtransferase UBA4 [Pseudozyma hubeiensis]